MIRRFFFYLFLTVIVIGSTYYVYRKNAPDDIDIITEPIQYEISPVFTADTIDQAIIDHEGAVNVIFYDSDNTNSVYFFNSILAVLKDKTGYGELSNTIFCNLEDSESRDMTENKNHWGFYNCPALVCIEYKEGILDVSSSLEWSDTNHLTTATVEAWLKNNEAIPK